MKLCPFCERKLNPPDPVGKPVTVFPQGYFVLCGHCLITMWVPAEGDPLPLPPDAEPRIADFGMTLYASNGQPLATSPQFHDFLALFIPPAAPAALPSSPSP